MKTCFIANPRSGRSAHALSAVRAFAVAHGAEVMLTERSRHANELAQSAVDRGYELVVAVGGDGTMNEIASVLTGNSTILGLVPCGSGDGLGRHLGIHGTVAHALDVLAHGAPRVIDSGLADGHPFFTVAGLGFEAEISRRFNLLERRGFPRYVTTSLRALRSWQPQEYTIVHDGGRERVRAFTIAVGNSDQYGNDARITSGARIDDGLLDLCAVPPVTPWNAVPLLWALFRFGATPPANATRLRATRFTIERESAGPIHTDGEVHEAGRVVEFSIRPASLRVMCPSQ